MAYGFGSGTMVGVRTDVANATPAQFGVVQDAEVDFSFAIKELIGQNQMAVALARSSFKGTVKIKSAVIRASLYNNLFFGMTSAVGGIQQVTNEAGTVPATSTYTVTAVNGSTFATDLGVVYAATGVPFAKVGATPATGQYSVNATTGVYTFSSGDASAAVLLSYSYTATTGSTKITLTNPLMGAAPTFQLNLAETFQGKNLNLQLNACVSSKLTFPFKNTDFVMNDFEAEIQADASNTVGYITTTDA